MISIRVYLNPDGKVYGVEANNHGDRLVCAAVSTLVINTANSIELLTDEEFLLDYKPDGGYLKLKLSDGFGHDAWLLMSALRLGLGSIADEYPEELTVEEVCVGGHSPPE